MTTKAGVAGRYNNPFLALRFRNYRIFWIGQCISVIGTWMQNIAQPWLTLTISNDAFKVSLVSAVQFLPPLFLSLFSGAILDRVDKKKVLMITQTAFMLIACAFAAMYYTNHVKFEYILSLAFLTGFFNAFDAPCRQSFLYELVDDKEDLPNAIALNSMAFNIARILGPSLAGFVIAVLSTGACFLFNAASYLAILISLFFIRTIPVDRSKAKERNIMQDIKEGVAYARSKSIIAVSLLIILVSATFLPNFNVLVSAFSKFTLQGNEKTFGFLMSFLGIGSFAGAFTFAMNSRRGPRFKLALVMPFIAAMLLMITGSMSNFWTFGIFLACTGYCFMTITSTLNSTIQLNTDSQYRGRVMSLYTMFFMGSSPLGSLYSGYFARTFSPRIGFYACGAAALFFMSLIALLYYRKKKKEQAKMADTQVAST